MIPLLWACTAEERLRHPAATDDTAAPEAAPELDPDAELWIIQLDIDSWSIGESTLVIGPDGSSVLIDVGNDSHADTIEAAVDAYLGHPPDYVLLTHQHADHIGAVDDLGFVPREALLWRGPVDLVDDSNEAEVEEVVATGWPERLIGGWDEGPLEIDLGGATMMLLAIDGVAYDGARCDVGDDENARSLLGTLRWGDFDYVFAGDLTGGGKDTPDCEAAYAELGLLPEADLLHLSHHGISSSSGDGWLDVVLPPGADRNAIVGANAAYALSPEQEVVDRVVPRLGDGRLWVSRAGVVSGTDEKLVVADSDVVVRVRGGCDYEIAGGEVREFEAVGCRD